ncbi:fumarylacetoacetate hydrolase family protein [Nocardia carnea]|uniref:Fumarylacetoacetate hydrolase family protein n=1 Tax=Nocardia carnea TaxID=37328 RepID=A0ABW7TDR2_9NOCA|nr:fumarylacetoacetate hydrolase family protein [Nocardia carnea]
MRLATFTAPDLVEPRVGLVDGDTVYPFPAGLSMRDVIDAGLPEAHRLAGHARAEQAGRGLSELRLLAPLRPASIRDSVAFEEHVEGVRRSVDGKSGVPDAWYDAPTFYFTNPHAVLGPDDEALFPATCVVRDFELEVAAVVGRTGRSLPEDQAREAIFGYTIMNDWSARDLQSREMQVSLGPAKGKDFATSLGPWIVTADEFDPYRDADGFLDLDCAVSVNGVEIGRDVLSNAGWTFESMIAYASRDSGVVPGDVIGSGTVGNGGCLGELWGRRGEQDPRPLQPGDVVTLTVEGIGALSGRVGIADPAPPLSPVRRRDYAAFRRSPR